MSELVIRQPTSELAIQPDQMEWTPQQLATLQHLGVENAGEGDLRVFFHQAKRTGLDPFAKQIYMIGRNSREKSWENGRQVERWVTKYTIQTGIDGYRLIARRAAAQTGEKLRQSEPLWCGKDMQWLEAWPFDEPPVAAKVVVYRDGEPFAGVAMYREYVQTNRDGKPNSMWARMPANQLAKCAEAQALRKAYPQELAGIFVDEEMGQADRTEDGAHVVTSVPSRRVTAQEITGEVQPPAPDAEPSGQEPATSKQLTGINAALGALYGWGRNDRENKLQFLAEVFGREFGSSADLTKDEASSLIDRLNRAQEEQDAAAEAIAEPAPEEDR